MVVARTYPPTGFATRRTGITNRSRFEPGNHLHLNSRRKPYELAPTMITVHYCITFCNDDHCGPAATNLNDRSISGHKTLRIFCATFHPAQSHQSKESVTIEPVLVALRPEIPAQVVRFFLRQLFVELHEEIRRSEVPVIFWNFIFQYQMIPERVPR